MYTLRYDVNNIDRGCHYLGGVVHKVLMYYIRLRTTRWYGDALAFSDPKYVGNNNNSVSHQSRTDNNLSPFLVLLVTSSDINTPLTKPLMIMMPDK